MVDEKRTTPNGHLVALAAGVIGLIFVWYVWLTWGMYWTRSEVLKRLQTSQSLTAPRSDDEATSAQSPAERERFFAELGQTGDSFGALNALLTAIAGALVFWAGAMQYQSLMHATQEANEERAHRLRLEFESLFFQLLELSTKVTERIERTVQRGPGFGQTEVVGPGALDSFAEMLYSYVPEPLPEKTPDETLKDLVGAFSAKVYDNNPSTFGPYFRLLYQTFKHIAESPLTEREQIRYANIARGQMSEGAVLLLALNGLGRNGYKFRSLIERFGLLEHLHPRYRKRYEKALLTGYRPRSFMGSADRAKPGNELQAKPLLQEDHFGAQ